MNINGETQIIGFFGSTYKTSKMYAMYNTAFEALGLNYIYVPYAVDNLEKAVEGVRHLGIRAIGITIPYKIEIMPFLDELDNNAKRIGAVNLVLNENGKLIGGNTDGEGAVMALEEKTTVTGKNVVLLGAGGAGRAIAFAVKDKGGTLTILNRTEENAKDLASAVGCEYGGYDKLAKILPKTDVVINATSVGMSPKEDESLIPKELLHSKLVIQDIVSKPNETKMLREAKEAGCEVIYADRMLLWQGVIKFKYYTGVQPPVEVMEEAINKMK